MKNAFILMLGIVLITFISCKQGGSENASSVKDSPVKTEHKGQAAVKDNVSDANALQVARSLDDFSTLVAAIEAAGVEDAVAQYGVIEQGQTELNIVNIDPVSNFRVLVIGMYSF